MIKNSCFKCDYYKDNWCRIFGYYFKLDVAKKTRCEHFKEEKLKCDRCGLRSPTIRKIFLRIEHRGEQINIVYEQVCTICAPILLHAKPSQPV